MNTKTVAYVPNKVKDISLAAWGRKEMELAEAEMPGLMALRKEYGQLKPLKGARIAGCLHMTIQTAVLIETLTALGAEVTWSSCNIFSTQDQAAAAIAETGVPVFAKKGETLAEYWEYVDKTFDWSDGKPANMILDDGGDATLLIHLGAKAEQDLSVIDSPSSEEEVALFSAIRERLKTQPNWYSNILGNIQGVTEETTTGVARLYQMQKSGELPFPAINVNDSVTKSKFDNKYGCRESLVDAIRRATDLMMAGKVAVVAGFGDVGKGSAQSLNQEGMIVKVTEADPICAMQACLDGFEVVSTYNEGDVTKGVNADLLGNTDLLVTSTGNFNVCGSDILAALKSGCVVCNIGHFDNEIDTAFMRKTWEWDEIKPQVHKVYRDRASNDHLLLLAEGRLVNLGNATGHPSRIMDGSFANQVLAQIDLYKKQFAAQDEATKAQMLRVEVLPKHLDEEVAGHMVRGFGGVVTKLTQAQADYINVPVDGPFKGDSYKY